MKIWEISAGRRGGESRILRVWGPDLDSLTPLAAEFTATYRVGVRTTSQDPEDAYDAVTRSRDGEDRARADGLEGDTVTELFVDWLIKRKGFTRGRDDGYDAAPILTRR